MSPACKLADAFPMTRYNNVLEMIGNTPIVRVQNLDTGPCELYLKLESTNPGGSIKDRIALHMIEAAEARGELTAGATLVEGTAGNTGLGLALVAQAKGYRLVLVIPDKMSREKIFTLKAMGAEVIITRSDVGKGHPEYYQDLAQKVAADITAEGGRAYFINQFANPDNPDAHERTTGPEMWSQMDEDLDAVVVGVGSSGTITGLSRYFSKVAPSLELVLADPKGSILADYIATDQVADDAGGWLVEGIGEDFLPSISDFSRVHTAYSISDRESFEKARELLEKEGLMGGLIDRHLGGGRPSLLPSPNRAQAGVVDGVRYRQPVSVQGLQRLLASRARPHRWQQLWRLEGPDCPPHGQSRRGGGGITRKSGQRLQAHNAVRHLTAAGDGKRAHCRLD